MYVFRASLNTVFRVADHWRCDVRAVRLCLTPEKDFMIEDCGRYVFRFFQ